MRSVTVRVKATAWGNLGVAHTSLGQIEQAIKYHEQALTISREIKDRRGEGSDLGNLGQRLRDSRTAHAGDPVLRTGTGDRP